QPKRRLHTRSLEEVWTVLAALENRKALSPEKGSRVDLISIACGRVLSGEEIEDGLWDVLTGRDRPLRDIREDMKKNREHRVTAVREVLRSYVPTGGPEGPLEDFVFGYLTSLISPG